MLAPKLGLIFSFFRRKIAIDSLPLAVTRWEDLKHDPKKWIPVFEKDHAPQDEAG